MTDTHVSRFQEHELETIRTMARGAEDCPVLMLNQNRYTSAAGYPDGDEYRTYMSVLAETIARVDGKILWQTTVHGQPIGCAHDLIHEILAIWYPSHKAFVGLAKAEGAEEMLSRRLLCVEHAVLHRCPGDQYPLRSELG